MSIVNLDPVRIYTIGDREYSLHTHHCLDCDATGYCIYRVTGFIPSCFILPDYFDPDSFEAVCDDFDEDLFESAPELASDFCEALRKVNSKHGIEVDLSFSSRLLEYGRTRIIRLKKLSAFDAITSKNTPSSHFSDALQAAFEFGFAAGHYATQKHTEELFWEGFHAREAREEGQTRARAALIRKGKMTRQTVIRAAQCVYGKDPTLQRNDSATARAIQKMDWPELSPNGKILSLHSITKHLREARKCDNEKNLQENLISVKSSR